MKDKRINLLLFFACFFALQTVSAQTLTLRCGGQEQMISQQSEITVEFFESDTLHLLFTDKSGTTGLITGEILITPKRGNSYYQKNFGKKPFIISGMIDMHTKKTLTDGTKMMITIKRKNNPDACFVVTVI